MRKVFNDKWHWGWLQWGHESKGFLTKAAEEDLKKIKEENPDIDFEKLAKEVREGAIPAYFEFKDE